MCSECEEEIQRTPEGIQRMCLKCGQEEKEKKSYIQPKELPGHTPEVTRAVQDQVNVVGSGGQPLPMSARAFFEPRFGHDFNNVRIHTGAQAAESARSVQAMAYTLGHNIVFGTGKYEPATMAGQHLLAHELTHVLQQKGAPTVGSATVQRQAEGSEPTTQGVLNPKPEKGKACLNAEKGFSRKEPEPSCPKPTHRGKKELARFHFCSDSNQPVDTASFDAEIEAIVKEQPESTRFLVHGHASTDGDPAGNFRLSCHRANRVSQALSDKGIKTDRIDTGSRGPTKEFPGGLEANRVVVVYGQEVGRFGEVQEEPSCKEAPRKLGDIKPEINCDEPTIDLTRMSHSPQLKHFHFCLDSDVLTEESVADIKKFAFSQAGRASFVIHGFASTEGNDAYNKVLSCHRALRIMRELVNLGVRPLQIREVSGLGEFADFGDVEANRVAVVLAEEGEISPFQEPSQTPQSVQQKRAVLNEARGRLISGQYRLEADAYISYWTCGRTPSLAQAVNRLNVLLQEEAQVSVLPEGDKEEAQLINSAILADRDLRAPNPLECVQARLVDIAFHHAVMNNTGLPKDLVDADRYVERHQAGRHLVHLAGFSSCKGNFEKQGTRDDKPLTTDPRLKLDPPACAEAPQPTRLLQPRKGERERKAPRFKAEMAVLPNSGSIDFRSGKGGGGQGPKVANIKNIKVEDRDFRETQARIITAGASVHLVSNPDLFSDYEVGFIQTVLGDENVVEYVSGHRVIQQLPIPIRDADDSKTPAPWMELNAVERPNASGEVNQIITGIPFLNVTAPVFQHFDPTSTLSGNFFDTYHRRTRIAIWLIARRLGAPLDRFSIHFLEGAIYDLIQDVRAVMKRVINVIDPLRFPSDKELLGRKGEFKTILVSESAADPLLAQLHSPIAREIDLNRHLIQILAPQAAPKDQGLSFGEYAEVVRQILDNFVIFESPEAASKGQGKPMPRLGFEFVPLTFKVLINKKTGRMALSRSDLGGPSVTIEANTPTLGTEAREGLATALRVRLSKRDPLGTGQNVVLRIPDKDGNGFVTTSDPDIGILTFKLPPRKGGKKEPNLREDSELMRDLMVMWACSERQDPLDQREFGALYWMDREGVLHRFPEVGLILGAPETPDGFHTAFPIDPDSTHPSGITMGTAHTHPRPDSLTFVPPGPSAEDKENARKGRTGRQHFVVDQHGVFAYFSDGTVNFIGDLKSFNPGGVKCDDKDLSKPHKPGG